MNEEIEITMIRQTDKAALVESHLTGERAWVPTSMCLIYIRKDNTGTLEGPHNILLEKGLI